MALGTRRSVDVLALIAAVIAIFMMGVYVGVIREQHGEPAIWFIVSLAVATILALYGVGRDVPRREIALAVSGGLFLLLGVVGIFSIGLPLIGAGFLAFIAFGRAQTR